MSEQVWVRVGDCGEYESFASPTDALEYLNDRQAGTITGWVDGGMGIGIETANYWGHDFISLFWGDTDANFLRALNQHERATVKAGLEEVYI